MHISICFLEYLVMINILFRPVIIIIMHEVLVGFSVMKYVLY